MIRMFRLETGQSIQPAQGMQNRDHLAHALARVQSQLYTDFDWPHLRVYREEKARRGERVYSWPDDIAVEDVRQLYDSVSGQWVPMVYGIDMNMRNAQPGLADPASAWQIVDGRQYEIYPVPATDRSLAIYGYKTLPQLVNDADKAVLDDNLIVLFAAAEFLARNKMADARAKLEAAQRLKLRLQGRMVSDKRRNVIPLVAGGNPNVRSPSQGWPRNLPPPIPR
jgi:hypothetical protein